MRELMGLEMVCKTYGRMKFCGTMFVWDWAHDCAVKESEIPMGSERHAASEREKYNQMKQLTAEAPIK